MKRKVVIEVRGGVVDVVELPDDVDVEVRDYDCDGYEETRVEEDANGDRCVVIEYGKE